MPITNSVRRSLPLRLWGLWILTAQRFQVAAPALRLIVLVSPLTAHVDQAAPWRASLQASLEAGACLRLWVVGGG